MCCSSSNLSEITQKDHCIVQPSCNYLTDFTSALKMSEIFISRNGMQASTGLCKDQYVKSPLESQAGDCFQGWGQDKRVSYFPFLFNSIHPRYCHQVFICGLGPKDSQARRWLETCALRKAACAHRTHNPPGKVGKDTSRIQLIQDRATGNRSGAWRMAFWGSLQLQIPSHLDRQDAQVSPILNKCVFSDLMLFP